MFAVLALLSLPAIASSSSCPGKCTCNNDTLYTTVNCSDTQLQHYPDNIYSSQVIDLSHNRIRDTSWESILNSLKLWDVNQQNAGRRVLILNDNIFTEIPEALTKFNISIDLRNNPLHCDCTTLRLGQSILVHTFLTMCSTTSNPDIRNTLLSSIDSADLNCGQEELVLPAEITLYKIPNQIIPCRKAGGGSVSWIRHGQVLYHTDKQDCSLLLNRYVNSRDTGYYKVLYQTPYKNKTDYVNVRIEKESSKPVIKVENQVIEVEKKGIVKIECNASGSPEPTIQWFKNNHSIGILRDKNIISADEKTLIITNVEKEMVFKCVATNIFGTTDAGFLVRTTNPGKLGVIFSWLGPLSLSTLVLVVLISGIYILHSKHTVAKLKERCASPGSTGSGTIFENSEATSSITQYDGYKIVAISTSSPPHQLICPITRECMKNPVVASDGFSYEEKAILAWFKRNSTSPMTNNEISKRLIQNHNLRTLTRDLMDKNPISDSFVNVESVAPKESTATQTRHSVTPVSHSNLQPGPTQVSNVSIVARARLPSDISRTSRSGSLPPSPTSAPSQGNRPIYGSQVTEPPTTAPSLDTNIQLPSSSIDETPAPTNSVILSRDAIIPMENSQV